MLRERTRPIGTPGEVFSSPGVSVSSPSFLPPDSMAPDVVSPPKGQIRTFGEGTISLRASSFRREV